MEGSSFGFIETKHTNAESNNSSYPGSESGIADGYDGSESGVEPDYAEWVFDSSQEDDILFDMSDEQAMAALRYFTSTAQRANMMAKTHSNDLDLIAQLLSDKEKDLEMTAKIGQSLLQRNKQLMIKIETMEDYLSQTTETAAKLEHDLQMKNKLVQLYAQDEEIGNTSTDGSREDKGMDDQELMNLTNRCRKLEKENQNLFTEALDLRQLTDEMEEKEESLVMDCIEQLASAKQQITQLTDEIALKFEDNLQQQMEISQLINMVVELQRKQKQLVEENEELQEQLIESNENQDNLQEQLHEMHIKFRETKELLLEHQEELKSIKSRFDNTNNPNDWLHDSGNSIMLQDSLANEIEETVRRDLTSSLALERSKIQDRRVLENVRYLNVKGSDTTSGRTSPVSTWSLASDERSDLSSYADLDQSRIRKPRKNLQIVKPMEGSDTLNKWHHLASKNIRGGLDVSSGEKSNPGELDKPTNSILSGDITSLIDPSEKASVERGVDEGISSTFPNLKQGSGLASTPQANPVVRPRGLSDLTQTKTIITRNSSALKSLRKGRSLLKSDQKGGRTQADVIGMMASAMGKVNIEAEAERRILSSFNSAPIPPDKECDSSPKANFSSMPNVAKALEKVAQMNEDERLLNPEFSLENDISYHEPEELNSSSECNSDVQSASVSTVTITPETLHSVSGPLGLLNRANPSKPEASIMNDLLRYSVSPNKKLESGDIDTRTFQNKDENDPLIKRCEDKTDQTDLNQNNMNASIATLNLKESVITRNYSAGSLVDIVANSRRKARTLGLSSLVSIDTSTISPIDDREFLSSIDGSDIVDEISKPNEDNSNSISQSLETGLDNVKEEGSGLFGFLSFLGKLS